MPVILVNWVNFFLISSCFKYSLNYLNGESKMKEIYNLELFEKKFVAVFFFLVLKCYKTEETYGGKRI